jgi:hypothetical protein
MPGHPTGGTDRRLCRHLNVLKQYLAVFTAVGEAESTFAKNATKAFATYSAAFKSGKTPVTASSLKLDAVSVPGRSVMAQLADG